MSTAGFRWAAAAMAATLVVGTTSIGLVDAAPVRPQVVAKKHYAVSATFTGGTGLTAVLMSPTGRSLASVAITTSPKAVTLTTPLIPNIAGSTIQLVNSKALGANGRPLARSGDYFGPVVLAWAGTTRTAATTVYTKLLASATAAVPLGAITVLRNSATAKQGYAYKVVNTLRGTKVDNGIGKGTKATRGKPKGVGNYGRLATGPGTKSLLTGGMWRAGAPTTDPDNTVGGDLDDDGIPNAFDVNDDGDAKTDASDSTTPSPTVAAQNPTTGAVCAPVEFRIFTNFKATQAKFAGTINYYGTGDFKATTTNIASTIDRTMSMVFSRITNVCGQAVTKTELKGVGVPYAPAVYTELPTACNTGDYQWQIGQGTMCGSPGGYSFGPTYAFTATDLPSGQDTFSMRVTTASGVYEFTASPGFVFVTHPMLVGFAVSGDDPTTGQPLTPAAGDFNAVDYSATESSPDGTRLVTEPALSVSQQQNLWLKIYRPQRLAIEGEASASGFVDLGGFRYTPDIPNGVGPGPSQGPGKCDAMSKTDSAFSDTATVDPLSATPPALTLVWDMEKCFGVPPRNVVWAAGSADFDIQVEPSGPGGNAAQKVRVTYI